jgi:hypothetical protein
MTAGDIYTVAGSAAGISGDGGDDGPATAATLHTSGGRSLDAARAAGGPPDGRTRRPPWQRTATASPASPAT